MLYNRCFRNWEDLKSFVQDKVGNSIDEQLTEQESLNVYQRYVEFSHGDDHYVCIVLN